MTLLPFLSHLSPRKAAIGNEHPFAHRRERPRGGVVFHLADGLIPLSGALRFLLTELRQELEQLAVHIEQIEMLIQRAAQQSEACLPLDAIPGIGPLTATAIIAAVGNSAASEKVGSSQPGLDWSRANTPQEASKSC